MEIHVKKQAFHNGKKLVFPQDAIYELGVVSYPGHGKYNNCQYVAFHELPDQEETANEEQRKRISPPGQGWWPVIALQKVAESTATGIKMKVLVVCWYQLIADGNVICWWIYM